MTEFHATKQGPNQRKAGAVCMLAARGQSGAKLSFRPLNGLEDFRGSNAVWLLPQTFDERQGEKPLAGVALRKAVLFV